MSFALARRIAPMTAEQAWSLICEQSEQFIWDDYGDEVECFNRLVADMPGIAQVAQVYHEEIRELAYKGRDVKVPLEFDSEDNLRAIHALSHLTRADYELRFCLDSHGSSTVAFLGLAPAHWAALEREYGAGPLARRFLPVAQDYATFYADAFESGAPDAETPVGGARRTLRSAWKKVGGGRDGNA